MFEMRVYYRESLLQYFRSVTLRIKFKSIETNRCILFIFSANGRKYRKENLRIRSLFTQWECHLNFLWLRIWRVFTKLYCILSFVILNRESFFLCYAINSQKFILGKHAYSPFTNQQNNKACKGWFIVEFKWHSLCAIYFGIVWRKKIC